METEFTLGEVLESAIQKEIDAQCLYDDLSQRVQDEAVKYALQELVKQEKGHQHLLERYLRGELKGGALNGGQTIDFKISEQFGQPEVSPGMELKEVFLLAANLERLSHSFYLDLAGVHPAGEVKKLFEELAAQELEHKERVETLYTQIAFPQTDGG